MMNQRLSRTLAALGLGLALVGAPAAAAAKPLAGTTSSSVSTPAAPEAARGDVKLGDAQEHRYAAREAASPRAADFKGGGAGIYIGGSTLAVVLVVVLVLVLL
jgi:hypothetical protein